VQEHPSNTVASYVHTHPLCTLCFSRSIEANCSIQGIRGGHLERAGLMSFLYRVVEHQSVGGSVLPG